MTRMWDSYTLNMWKKLLNWDQNKYGGRLALHIVIIHGKHGGGKIMLWGCCLAETKKQKIQLNTIWLLEADINIFMLECLKSTDAQKRIFGQQLSILVLF